MKTKRFLLILLTFFVLYLLPEIFVEDAMLYISGGIIGGTINEVLEVFYKDPKYTIILLIWITVLIGVIFLFFKLQSRGLKYFIIAVIVLLLYVVDNVLAIIPVYDVPNVKKAALWDKLLVTFSILSKSLVVSVIVYYGLYKHKKKLNEAERD